MGELENCIIMCNGDTRRGPRKGSRVVAAQPIYVQKKSVRKRPRKQLLKQMSDGGVQKLPCLKRQSEEVQESKQELPRLQRQNEEAQFNCVECGQDSTCSVCSLFSDPLQDVWATMKSHIVAGCVSMTFFPLDKMSVVGEPFW